MTDSYVTLLSIERMLAEKATGEGRYLSEIGFIVFAITVGGNPICLDVNATKNGDAPGYICNHNLCSWNEKYGYAEIGWPSELMGVSEMIVSEYREWGICRFVNGEKNV